MKTAIIFGGSGYIGIHTCYRLKDMFDSIILADIVEPKGQIPNNVIYTYCDVRKPIITQLEQCISEDHRIDWIFNFAAVHREPGHKFEEYFDTNIPGANNVIDFAETYSVNNILFTASIAVYGPTKRATDEDSPKYPSTGYGISKLLAECIHEQWASCDKARRLIVCRPGVVYGPGDPGNILRMILAIKKGLFFFPGSSAIYKSYAYIEGLLDSFEHTMSSKEKVIHYNYVEYPTEPLRDIVSHIKSFLKSNKRVISIPLPIILFLAYVIQFLTRGNSTIHPKRVRKAATSTHIIPQKLIEIDFKFHYDFQSSLEDWKKKSPDDFL